MPEELTFETATARPDLLARPVLAALVVGAGASGAADATIAEIDPEAADTPTFCERYGISMQESANCVVVAGRRGGETQLAACMVLATTKADVNGLVRRELGARKASFASMDRAVAETGMEYGGITPLGLPADWPLLIDSSVAEASGVIIGSGLRRSKLWVPGALLAALPSATIHDGLGQ